MKIASVFVLAALVLSSVQSWAQAVDFSIHNDYIATRAMGMGGAFTAVVDDHNALFYNPAALARREDGNIHLFLRAAIDAAYLDLAEDLDTASNSANEEEAVADILVDNYGNNFYSRLPTVGGVWVRPNWGIAFIPADLTVDIGMHQSIGPAISLNAYADSTLAYGYAKNVKWGQKGKLSVGATAKLVSRIEASESVGVAQLASDSEVFDQDAAREGLFADVDLGFLYTPKITSSNMWKWFKFAKPSFALVVRNLIDSGPVTNLGLVDENSSDADNLHRRIDLGSKWNLPNFWVFDPKLAWDMKNFLHPNWSFQKGNHLGFEMYWKMYSWWKGYWSVGLNQWAPDDFENLTFGFGGRFAWFQLDLATWQEYVGTDDIDIRSRRYMVELSLDF